MDALHNVFVILNIIVAVGFLLSGIDDLFIDIYYWLRELYRKVALRKRIQPVTHSDLANEPEKWTAIWIPAWHEHEIIDKMVINTLEAIEYRNYDIFVGVYPNDDLTQKAVDSISANQNQVQKIVCPNPGPTNKADCLNSVYQGMLRVEREKGIRYEIVVMHDSEDIVHPLELKLFNWLIPRKDMVQIPVIPLETPASFWTSGTYLDEFAENHQKDLMVRERLSAIIPSAGVGTGMNRDVLDELARERRNQVFNTNSLTEDYEFGLGLMPLGRKAILARFMIERTQWVTRGLWNKRQELVPVREPVAVREFFPDSFKRAVKQKSRWVLGISIQGWKNIGWRGDFWNRYMLYRDRKGLFANFINAAGYVVVTYWLTLKGLQLFGYNTPNLIQSHWVWQVILVDTGLMFHRLLERCIAVRRVSSWKQALMAIPRAIVGNAINFCATTVAIKQFVHSSATGQRIAWQKTDHSFPSTAQLREHRRRLGDLLLENRLVKIGELREALDIQQSSDAKRSRKLGQLLTRLGYVSDEDLLAVVGKQLGAPTFAIDHRLIDPEWLRKFPRRTAEELLALPVRFADGVMDVVCSNPAAPGLRAELERLMGSKVRLGLARDNEIRFAITRAYLAVDGRTSLLLGELFVDAGFITPEQLKRALDLQERTGQRLGEVLQDQGLVSAELLATALKGHNPAQTTEAGARK
jgi:bacteriophage N4 adsorption protein B